MKVANDAPSRNAFSKLHTALTKVIGEAGTTKKSEEDESVAEVVQEESTMIQKVQPIEKLRIKIGGSVNEGGNKIEGEGDQGEIEAQDSLLEELLDDEDMEL